TPNSYAWLEAGLAALAETCLTQDERIAASLPVTGAARWKGLHMAGDGEERRTSGVRAEDVAAREARLLDAVIAEAGYAPRPRGRLGSSTPSSPSTDIRLCGGRSTPASSPRSPIPSTSDSNGASTAWRPISIGSLASAAVR